MIYNIYNNLKINVNHRQKRNIKFLISFKIKVKKSHFSLKLTYIYFLINFNSNTNSSPNIIQNIGGKINIPIKILE